MSRGVGMSGGRTSWSGKPEVGDALSIAKYLLTSTTPKLQKLILCVTTHLYIYVLMKDNNFYNLGILVWINDIASDR